MLQPYRDLLKLSRKGSTTSAEASWVVGRSIRRLLLLTLAPTFAFIVEAGVFLDLVAAVLIMLALVFGLARRLAGATASELRGLRG